MCFEANLEQEVGHLVERELVDRLGAHDPCFGKSSLFASAPRSVSPTVGFVIDQDVYVPFTFAQCVQLLVTSHPAEETHFVVAHPEFTPFWMKVLSENFPHISTPTQQVLHQKHEPCLNLLGKWLGIQLVSPFWMFDFSCLICLFHQFP
jgi:hypothetical protein